MATQRIRHGFRPSVECLERSGALMIDSKVMAEFLGVPNQTFEQLVYTDRIPFPMRFPFGTLMRWSVLELLEWVEAGCPRRKKWIKMRGSSGWYPAWRWEMNGGVGAKKVRVHMHAHNANCGADCGHTGGYLELARNESYEQRQGGGDD